MTESGQTSKKRPGDQRAGSKRPRSSGDTSGEESSTVSVLGHPNRLAAVGLLFALACLVVYSPAVSGPFVSDDSQYLVNNPYVQDLSADHLIEILDPRGALVPLVANYAPVHLLLHALGWSLFGADPTGHHLMNLLAHAAVSLLFVLMLWRSGLPEAAALFGGAVFLLHPANVEAVAWVTQLKTTTSMLLALLALLALDRRPGWATVAFGTALLAKPIAAVALPVAILQGFGRARRGQEPLSDPSRRWRWLGGWGVVFIVFAIIEMIAFQHAVSYVERLHPDLLVQLRTSIAHVFRYLVMATTTLGLSAFHEPDPSIQLLDPAWLGGLVCLSLLGARTLYVLVQGREEAVYWAWAAISFLPISQVFPFPFPIADRYLYAILPGLLGATLLAGYEWVGRRPALLKRATPWLMAAACLLLVGLGLGSYQRARLWGTPAFLLAESVRNYPQGVHAQMRRAQQAAEVGDAAGAIDALRACLDRGYDSFDQLLADPRLLPLRGDPRFRAVLSDMAERWIDRWGGVESPSQPELLSLGVAHRMRGDNPAARRALERGLAIQGPLEDELRSQLAAVE
ncbi:MAG: hypothetical protein JRG95_04155, partial [Deltaproteobacteria bacterium]|nr:hypothetical protein [Deltaproteobacteria bacterium]